MTLLNQTIICAADSNNIEPRLYEHTREIIGDTDVMFLGMECEGGPMSWLYGPLVSRPISRKLDQARRLNGSNYERGIELIGRFNPKQAYVYAMGQEPWLTYLTSIEYTEQSRPIVDSGKLVEECRRRGIKARFARRGIERRDRLGRHRWKVERTHAWFGGFRRLVTRYERRDDIHLGLNLLAMCVITHRQWNRLC